MENRNLDILILELRSEENNAKATAERIENLRKQIFGVVEDEGLTDGYKNDYATVSYVQRKSVKIEDENVLLDQLKDQRIVKYFKVIPEHAELTPEFSKDVKSGVFKHDLVKVEESQGLQIRFNK